MHPPLSIALHGFTRAEKAALALYLERNLPPEYRLVEGAAQLPIVNLDSPEGERLWQWVAGQEGLPSIVLSLRQRQLPRAHWLSRPLQLPALLGLVARLAPQAGPAETAARRWYSGAADAHYRDPAVRAELFYDPEVYFQGALRRALDWARESGQAIRLRGGGMCLVVQADGRRVATVQRDAQLVRLGFLKGEAFELAAGDGLPDDARLLAADDLLWRLAIWTARGRVPLGTALEAPVGLRGWPNFTRLQRPPHAMRIIAQWQARPLPLLDTAQLLAVPCRAVFSVYSGCAALGLVERAAGCSEARADEAPALPARLLNALLGRLRLLGQGS